MSYCGIVVATFCIAQHFPMTLFGILLAVLNFGHGLEGRVICLILDIYERPMCWMLLTSDVFESFHLVSGILSVFVSVFVLSSDLCPEYPMYLYPCIGSFNLAYCQGFLCPILDLTECPMCEMFPASVPGPDRLEVSPPRSGSSLPCFSSGFLWEQVFGIWEYFLGLGIWFAGPEY